MTHPPVTPFTGIIERAASECYSWFEFNGFKFPDIVRSPEEDLAAGRAGVSFQDVSPMMKFIISGPDSSKFLDRISTRRLSHLKVGRVSYFLMVTQDGFIRDDGTAYRLSEDTYLVQSVSDLSRWLESNRGDLVVSIKQAQTRWAEISIYGRESASFLKAAGIEGLETLKPFNFMSCRYAGSVIMVSRTGFSGGLGYELMAPWDEAERVLEQILRAGGEDRVTFTGNFAGVTLRLDIGFLIPGWDFAVPADDAQGDPSAYRTPFDMGWSRLVEFDSRDDFIGKQALQAIAASSPRFDFMAVVFEGEVDPADLTGGRVYNSSGDDIGQTFAGGRSPTISRYVAFSNIKHERGRIGGHVTVGAMRATGKPSALPLVDVPERGQTPPPGV